MKDVTAAGGLARPWPLSVRLARPEDRDAVLAFATNTWNGWDYMPHAWERWLEERDGVMLVGTVAGAAGAAVDADGARLESGTVAAVVRVAMPAADEAWLEGIRVDPRVRGMDVATDLQVAELHWAAANGARVVRYATSARNEGSHRLGARGGFELIATLCGISWEPVAGGAGSDDAGEQSGFVREVQAEARRRRTALLENFAVAGWIAAQNQTDALWAALSGDASFNAARRLYEPRPWALEELTKPKFAAHVRLREVIVQRDAIAIIVRDVAPAEESAMRFSVLAGSAEGAWQIVETASGHAEASVRFRYADGAPVVAGFEQRYRDAGYAFSEWPLHIMARALDAAHPPPPVDPAVVVLEETPKALIISPG